MRKAPRHTVIAGFARTACAAVAVVARAALHVTLACRRWATAAMPRLALFSLKGKRVALANTFTSRHGVAGEAVPREAEENSAVAFASRAVHVAVDGWHDAHCVCSLTARLVTKGCAAIRANALTARVANARETVPPVTEARFAAALKANVLGVAGGRRTKDIRAFAAGTTTSLFALAAHTTSK